MLNYNVNYIEPLKRTFNNSDFRPKIYWDFDARTVVSDNGNLPAEAFATMSINAPNSNCINISNDNGNSFTTDGSAPITASLTGSGNWPATGSTEMIINIAGIPSIDVDPPYYAQTKLTASYNSGSLNLSGSIISSSVLTKDFFTYYISGSVIHYKGNPFNPLVNWKTQNESPVTTTGNINGYTASFNLVKDSNVNLATINQVTASFASSFQYLYNLGVTSSLTASINQATGSTTMSISIPEAGVSASQQWFNPSTTTAILSASFLADNNNPYTITSSVIFNKGNISNSVINWRASGSSNSTSAWFKLVKNANETEISDTMLNTLSIGSLTNEYAFSQTASLSGALNWPNSSSFKQITMSLSIPEISISRVAYTTASLLTASFAATTGINPYTITASVITVPFDSYAVAEYIMIGGGASGQNGGRNQPNLSGAGGGAGGLVSGSNMIILPDSVYTVTIGIGGISSEASGSVNGTDSSFVTGSTFYLRAPGGGIANPSTGGSGGGATGGPAQFQSYTGSASIPATGSGTFFTNITGSKGGNGYAANTPSAPTATFSISGGGGGAGGAGQNASTGNTCNDGGAGGAGVYNAMVAAILGVSGSLAAGGDGGLAPGGCSDSLGGNGTDAQFFGGGGQGGHGDGNNNNFWRGGYGKDGVFILKYLGTQKGRGGTVTYDGTYTYHTYTSSGLFYSTANLLPDY